MPDVLCIPPDAAPAPLNVLGESVTVLAGGAATGSYEVFIQSGPEGVGPPPHTHPWDEGYFVLEGDLQVVADGVARIVRAGGFVHVPAGHVHSYVAVGGPARFLSITSRPGAARFFGEMDREVKGLPPDIPAALAVAARHRVVVVPPAG